MVGRSIGLIDEEVVSQIGAGFIADAANDSVAVNVHIELGRGTRSHTRDFDRLPRALILAGSRRKVSFVKDFPGILSVYYISG